MFGTLGVPEIAVIFILALVLFGPKKLPELGRTIGKAMTEFRRASSELKATFDREMQTLERENQALQASTQEAAKQIYDHSSYEISPPESIWNPLDPDHQDQGHDQGRLDPAMDQHATATPPSTVGASEVQGAESSETAIAPATHAESAVQTAASEPVPIGAHAIEGTVPRSGAA
jgi:sec-independent protein translocase protein TatA